MKPSMVEKSKEFDDCIIYKTSCECLSNDHNLTIFLEKFKDTEQLSMSFYVKCSVNSYFDINKDSLLTKIFNHIKSRTYYAFKILFTGNVSLDQEFIFKNKQHVQDILDALEEGKETFNDRNIY